MNMKKTLICAASVLTVGLAGCSQYDADGVIVVVKGTPYELQHRFLDAYVLHKIDEKELAAANERLDAIRAR